MNKHEELAGKYFTDGYNCAQAVFAAFHCSVATLKQRWFL